MLVGVGGNLGRRDVTQLPVRLREIIEKHVPLGVTLDADSRKACVEDIVDDLALSVTDQQVKLVARALCRAAGADPEGAARSGYSWINHEADARALIASLG